MARTIWSQRAPAILIRHGDNNADRFVSPAPSDQGKNLMAGQHSDPLRVVRFNTDTDRAEVSQAIAQEILRRLDFEGRNVLSELEGVIDRHVGRDRGWPNT